MATRVAGDDPEAEFESLYRRHVRDVYRYALAVVRDPADADDLTQATFLRAWRAFSEGVSPRAPQNWFLRIAHNVLRTHFRTQSRRPRQVELDPELEAAPDANGPTAADVLEALGELPLTQREALVMRELEGRSYGEIAQILGVSRSAVEALVFRARTHLRVRRSDLGRIASVPLPASLASFSSGSAGIGTGLVIKAIAVVAAGVVAVGVGKEAVNAVTDDPVDRPTAPDGLEPAAKPSVSAELGAVEAVRASRGASPTKRSASRPEAPGPPTPVAASSPPLVAPEREVEPALSPTGALPPVVLPPPPAPPESAPSVPAPQLPEEPPLPVEPPQLPLPPLPELPEIPTVPLP